MANGVFNIAKGRTVEFYHRVKNNDPANCAFIVLVLKASGIEADGTLEDYDTVSAILAATNDEATNTGYARITLTDAELAAIPAPDDTNNRFDIDIPDPVWTAVQATGGAWAKIIVAFDPDTTAGTDTTLVPCSHHDFAVTPDGSDLQGTVNAAGFYRAA